jgi:hypothetical protein
MRHDVRAHRLLLFAAILGIAIAIVSDPPAAHAQAGSWLVSGQVNVTVRVRGRVAHRHGRLRATFVLSEDGHYEQPGNLLCAGDSLDIAEEGTWRRDIGSRLVLEPTNLDELLSVIGNCVAGVDLSVEIDEYRHVFRLAKTGLRLVGRTVMRGRIVVDDESFPFHALARYRGGRTSAVSAVAGEIADATAPLLAATLPVEAGAARTSW